MMLKHKIMQWPLGLVTLPMAQASSVEGRLRAILEKTVRRGELTRSGRLVVGLCVLFALAGLTAFRVVSGEPAMLSSATPMSQDGFILLAIQRSGGMGKKLYVKTPQGGFTRFDNGAAGVYEEGQDATTLWIQLPQHYISPEKLLQEYYVTVHASDGMAFRLPYSLADDGHPSFNQPQLLCVTIPSGYPNTDRYFDVTLSDKHGHHATWRLTHLPKMKHFLEHPTLQMEKTEAGFTVQAFAWRAPNPGPGYAQSIMTGMHITAISAAIKHQWELDASDPIMEWTADLPYQSPDMESFPIEGRAPKSEWMTPLWMTPYAREIHYTAQNAQLRQFETYDEPVTFHSIELKNFSGRGYPTYCVVRDAQSVTTPSGITITLPAQHLNAQDQSGGTDDAINCYYQLPYSSKPQFLPQSPLCQRFHLPVTVHIALLKPENLVSCVTEGNSQTLAFNVPKPYPTHLTNFTIIVRQRVELQTIPLHFVVPVQNAPPASLMFMRKHPA